MTHDVPRIRPLVHHLVLFDIDGTLLLTDGAGRRAIHHALREVFGTIGRPDYRFDGKTDPQIVRELMRHEGFADSDIDARMTALLDRYAERIDAELAAPGFTPRALPGVHELLDALEARDDVVLGLLTGNIAAGATAKLRATGIDPARFAICAYGSDHEHRPELPAVAARRYLERHGHELSGDRITVIGDTPADMRCGHAIGARAIGVATGHFSVEELAEHGPIAVFPDLTDTAAIVATILASR